LVSSRKFTKSTRTNKVSKTLVETIY
jgi:hypothetical protein